MRTIRHIDIPAGKMNPVQMSEHDLDILFDQLERTNEKRPDEKYVRGMAIIEAELEAVARGEIYKGGFFYDTKWLTKKLKGEL